MPRRIAIVGPESCGKSTLAEALASALGMRCVPEVARTWLPLLGRPYVETDLVDLARAQRATEDAIAASGDVIADTTVLVVRVWSEARFGRVDPRIRALERLDRYALHLLVAPDLPWEPDPLRESPHDRDALFARYEAALRDAGVRYAVVRGQGLARLSCALAHVRSPG